MYVILVERLVKNARVPIDQFVVEVRTQRLWCTGEEQRDGWETVVDDAVRWGDQPGRGKARAAPTP